MALGNSNVVKCVMWCSHMYLSRPELIMSNMWSDATNTNASVAGWTQRLEGPHENLHVRRGMRHIWFHEYDSKFHSQHSILVRVCVCVWCVCV
jgi:hypothetical protein